MTNDLNPNYRGHTAFKKAGVPIEWNEKLVLEYIRCRDDPIYFIETYMKIIHVDHGLINFKLYPYQKEVILAAKNNRKCIVCQARQSGKTSAIIGFALWYVMFHEDKSLAILANKASTAREILSRVQFSYSNLPGWLQTGIQWLNKSTLSLENNSRIVADATSGDAIRGWSFSCVIVDEVAHIDSWEEFFTSVYPTISSGETTKLILISTPFGLNHFWEIWNNAIKGVNGYIPIRVDWTQVLHYDEKWHQETLAALNFNHAQFDQEYGIEFLGSSGTLIAGWKLKQLTEQGFSIPLVDKNGLIQYNAPEKDHTYVCVCDVSEGRGLDFSAFQMIDITVLPYKQVCVFNDNLTAPIDYAEVIFHTGKAYNNASILVETNNMGSQIVESLNYDFEYDNILYTENKGRAGKQISFGFHKTLDRGIKTTKPVKATGCSILKLLIEQDKLVLQDAKTIGELATFSRKNKSYEAEPGKHDDLVMGLVLFAWLADQSYFRELTDINTMAKLREKTEEQMLAELTPFGFMVDGHPETELINEPPSNDLVWTINRNPEQDW